MAEVFGREPLLTPFPQTVYLFADSAADTIRQDFLRGLRGPAITQFRSHRVFYTDGTAQQCEEALRSCAHSGFERLIVVADIQADGYQPCMARVLAPLHDPHRSSALRPIQSVELIAGVDNDFEAQSLFNAVAPLWKTFAGPPHVKAFVLSSPESAGNHRASSDRLISFLSALTLASPSRMAPVGLGLSALRMAPESALFLARYSESKLGDLQETARVMVERQTFATTFSPSPDDGDLVLSPERLERLMTANHVGSNEPGLAASYDFDLWRVNYRDGLLHILLSNLARQTPCVDDFLDALDRFASDLGRRSKVLSSLLSDVRNELVAARLRIDAAAPYVLVETPAIRGACATARHLVESLVRKHRFPVWPILSREVRPASSWLKPLYTDFDSCVEQVSAALRDEEVREMRGRQSDLERSMGQIAARLPAAWSLPAKTYVFVHAHLATDHQDELWPEEHRCGLLALLKREMRT